MDAAASDLSLSMRQVYCVATVPTTRCRSDRFMEAGAVLRIDLNHKETKDTKSRKILCALCVFVVLIISAGNATAQRKRAPQKPEAKATAEQKPPAVAETFEQLVS